MATTTTELMKVDSFKQIIEAAPNTLTLNQTSSDKATEAGERLLEKIKLQGMNEDLDLECNNFLVKLKKTVDLMQDRRKPITQIFDEVKKMFTSLEGNIDQKSIVYTQVQQARNNWAAQKAAEQRKKEDEAKKKLQIDKEKIEFQTRFTVQIQNRYLSYLEKQQQSLVTLFEDISLKDFDNFSKLIQEFPEAYPFAHFDNTSDLDRPKPMFITAQDVELTIIQAKVGKYETYSVEFSETIRGLKEIFINRLPSKKRELEAIEQANAEERKRIEDQAKERERLERERIDKENLDRAKKAETEAEVNKQVLTANTLFETERTLATNPETKTQVREGYEIDVTNPVGYLQIVAFYFEKEGRTEKLEKLEKKTLGSMKKFCEAWAQKNDEKIQNPYLVYRETFKAVAKS